MITSSDITWKFNKSWNLDRCHAIVHNATIILNSPRVIVIQRETITKKDKQGFANGEPKTYYFIDNDKREFKTEEELIQALNELKK